MYKRFGYSQKGVCTEKIKDESVFTKRSRLFTRIYKKIFTVPRPRPPLPKLAFSECVDNTGRSPASKNPSVPSGTCPAGERPVLETNSSARAISTHRGSLLNSPVSREEIVARAFVP